MAEDPNEQGRSGEREPQAPAAPSGPDRREEFKSEFADVFTFSDEYLYSMRDDHGAVCGLGEANFSFSDEEKTREEYKKMKEEGRIAALAGSGDGVGFDVYNIYKEKDPEKWFNDFQNMAKEAIQYEDLFGKDPETKHYYEQLKTAIQDFAGMQNPAKNKREWNKYLRDHKGFVEGEYGVLNFLLEAKRAVDFYKTMEGIDLPEGQLESEKDLEGVFAKIRDDGFQIIVRTRGEGDRAEEDKRYGAFVLYEGGKRVFRSTTEFPLE